MDGLIFLAFIFLFMLVVARHYYYAGGQPFTAPRIKREPLTHAARRAMDQAGYEADDAYVHVADIGVLAYRRIDQPKLVREGDVLMDTRFLRPFVDLVLPYTASGEVRFELRDGTGRLRYADEAEYDLAAGRNNVLPGTWLPLEGKPLGPGEWELSVLADDTLLAVHEFGWQPVGGGVIQEYVGSDGEMSDALQRALNARQRETVSLSELLADQSELLAGREE